MTFSIPELPAVTATSMHHPTLLPRLTQSNTQTILSLISAQTFSNTPQSLTLSLLTGIAIGFHSSSCPMTTLLKSSRLSGTTSLPGELPAHFPQTVTQSSHQGNCVTGYRDGMLTRDSPHRTTHALIKEQKLQLRVARG